MPNSLFKQNYDIDRSVRATMKRQRPYLLWFTGLSGSGKSTIANLLEVQLAKLGHHTYLLDGDHVRTGLCADLGFSERDRVENIRRVAAVSQLMVDAGLIVLTAFISPFRADRELARGLFPNGEFIEIHVATPLHECERRDPKGLYKKARSGQLQNFTGIDSPYEAPLSATICIDTMHSSPEQCASTILAHLVRHGFLTYNAGGPTP